MANYRNDFADVNLETGTICRNFMNHSIGSGDALGDRFGVHVFRSGEPVSLDGTVAGYFVRNTTGETVVISSGVVSGNEAYVTLPAACYAVEGSFTLAIKVTSGSETVTMRIVDGVVSRTNTSVTVDPGTLVPSIETLISAINSAVGQIPVNYNASFAPAYSASSTYAVGDYVVYDGYLWRCTTAITETETWTAAHWKKVALASDVSDLKSAFIQEIKGATGNEPIIFTENAQYWFRSSGSKVDSAPTASTGRACAQVPCVKNEQFRVKISAGSGTFLGYGFSDASGNVISKANANISFGNAMISAPDDDSVAFVTFNTNMAGGYYALRCSNRIESVLENVEQFAKNMFPLEWQPNITKGSYYKSDGTTASSNAYCRTTSKTFLADGYRCAVLCNSSVFTIRLFYFDENGNSLGTSPTMCNKPVYIPKGVYQFGANFQRTDRLNFTNDDVTALEATLSAFSYTDKTLTKAGLPADAKSTGERIEATYKELYEKLSTYVTTAGYENPVYLYGAKDGGIIKDMIMRVYPSQSGSGDPSLSNVRSIQNIPEQYSITFGDDSVSFEITPSTSMKGINADLVTGKYYKNYSYYELTGEEDFTFVNGQLRLTGISSHTQSKKAACSHAKTYKGKFVNIPNGYFLVSGRTFAIRNDSLTSLSDWVTYIRAQYQNNTPVSFSGLLSNKRTEYEFDKPVIPGSENEEVITVNTANTGLKVTYPVSWENINSSNVSVERLRIDDTTVYITKIPVQNDDGTINRFFVACGRMEYESGEVVSCDAFTTREFANQLNSSVVMNAGFAQRDNNMIPYGSVIENGVILKDGLDTHSRHVFTLGIYSDGKFGYFQSDETSAATMLNNGAVQVISGYGPIITNGEIASDYIEIYKGDGSGVDPWNALGYDSDMNYYICTSCGRLEDEAGLSITKVAEIMQSYGVVEAYLMDGGGSVSTCVNGSKINPNTDDGGTSDRPVSDVLYAMKVDKQSVTNANLQMALIRNA